MASNSAPGHSEEIMVAQPVDTITAAPASFRDNMSPEPGSLAKETQHMDIASDSLEFSEESALKDARGRTRSSTPRIYSTPRSSPSPASSASRLRVPKSRSLKRSLSTPISIPTMPRRGRVALTEAEMWGDSGGGCTARLSTKRLAHRPR